MKGIPLGLAISLLALPVHAINPLACTINTFSAVATGFGEGDTKTAAFNASLRDFYDHKDAIERDLAAWKSQKCPQDCSNRYGLEPNGAETASDTMHEDDFGATYADAGKRHLVYYELFTQSISGEILCSKAKLTEHQLKVHRQAPKRPTPTGEAGKGAAPPK